MKNLPMKNIFKCYFFIFLFVQLNFTKVYAQTNFSGWQFGVNFGFAVYQGDLSPDLAGSYNTIQPVSGFNISKKISAVLKLRTSLYIGKLMGDENQYSNPLYRKQRSLSFTTSFKEISETVVFNFLESNEDLLPPKFSPYIFAGIGSSFVNITRSGNISNSFFATEPQASFGLAQDLATTLPKNIMVVPVGFGVDYYLSPNISLNAEFNLRYTRTDYLDGFSKVANPKSNDCYYTNTVGILYRFVKKSKLDCPNLNF